MSNNLLIKTRNWLVQKINYLGMYILLAVLGSFLIWYFQGNLNDYLIFYTLVVILWYTRETMDLKINSNKELFLLKEAEMNKMIPILFFREGAKLHKDGNLSEFKIRNVGPGIAKEITVFLASYEIEGNFSLVSNELRTVEVNMHKNVVISAINQNPKEINMEIRYKDIYERRFRTVEITFTRDSESNYNLDRGKWKFQILD